MISASVLRNRNLDILRIVVLFSSSLYISDRAPGTENVAIPEAAAADHALGRGTEGRDLGGGRGLGLISSAVTLSYI